MRLSHIRPLRGPNAWAEHPVIEMLLDPGDADGDRIRAARDEVRAYQGRLDSDDDGQPIVPDWVLTEVVQSLQQLAGTSVSNAYSRTSKSHGGLLLAFEYAVESVGVAAVDVAWRMLAGEEFVSLEAELARLSKLACDARFPVSTAVTYHAARARGIPAERLHPEYGRFLRLGQGSAQHRCRASEPDTVSAIARLASTDKHLAKGLLAAAGVPVPRGRLVSSADEAWAAACELGVPVAVKPLDSDLAIGVSLDLRTREQVERAFHEAHEHSGEVIVECFAPGLEHCVLVVGDRISAVTLVEPPQVVGDGQATVAELVARVNEDPRRGEPGSNGPLYKLQLDAVAREVLAGQGHSPESVPGAGERVLVRRNPPYFKSGGNLADLTDVIHPANAAHAIAAARAVQLPVAGLDVVALDIRRPLEEQQGVVVEINTSPGLWLHLAPWADSPRPVGRDIVDLLFPPGSDGRIPVVGLAGDAGDAAGHLEAMLTQSGIRPGRVDAAQAAVAGRRWAVAGTPRERANVLFQNPAVDVALLVASARELYREGLGNDRCDVAVVLHQETIAGEEHAEFFPPSAHLHTLRHALTPAGSFVVPIDMRLPATDVPLGAAHVVLYGGTASMLDLPAATPVSAERASVYGTSAPRLDTHLAAGGRALVVRFGVVQWLPGKENPTELGRLPPNLSPAETNSLLAALAAALALGRDVQCAAYLANLPVGKP